jgi:predicted transcriptional regulator
MTHPPLPRLAMDIVIAYGTRHPIALGEVGALLQATATALGALGQAVVVPLAPAVPINRSIQHDHLVCLEDGRKGKLLKGYLRRVFKMTPAEYRTKWGLPKDYPMVAPAYAQTRSRLARLYGLGSAGRRTVALPAPSLAAIPPQSTPAAITPQPAPDTAAPQPLPVVTL